MSDNGPGIDPALGEHIFEPFVSSKANGQGLGLALVQKLVRDMDGRVGHERDEKAGMDAFPRPPAGLAIRERMQRMGRRALLVEDDNAIATVIVAGLEDEGFSVAVRDSVAGRDAALALADYDVMLTDVMLTDGDGIATLGEVRAALSGHAGDHPFGAEHARYRCARDRWRGV